MTKTSPFIEKIFKLIPDKEFSAASGAALRDLKERGLPLSTSENWRSSSLRWLSKMEPELLPTEVSKKNLELLEQNLSQLLEANSEWLPLVCVNGRVSQKHTRLATGIEFSELAEELYAQIFGTKPPESEESFFYTDILQRLSPKGFALKIGPNEKYKIHLIHVYAADGESKDLISPSAYAIDLGQNASLDLRESTISINGCQNLLAWSKKKFNLGSDARLNYASFWEPKNQGYQFSNSIFSCDGKGSDLTVFRSGGAAKFTRIDDNVTVNAESSRVSMQTAIALSENQHFDGRSHININAPKIECIQNNRYLMDGKSCSIFSGRIHIKENCNKVVARQDSRVLFLSDLAEAHSIPSLLIDSEDVKCSHGATMGQLNSDEIFYLQSRGMNEAEAKSLLCQGFLLANLDKNQNLAQWLKLGEAN